MEYQSKYYLSYPKPPVLDMKRANRDINVVEWANIPKFSKIDDIVTPLRLFELFFNDVLVCMIFGFTKLYSHREKAGISFEITNEKVRLFLSMLLLSECHKLPDRKMYWRRPPILIQCLVIRSSVYLRIFIFVTRNSFISKRNYRSSLCGCLERQQGGMHSF